MKPEKFEKAIIWVLFISFGIGIIVIVGTILVYSINGHIIVGSDIQPDKIGTFGDFIGGFVGPLFTISATLLIWLTYVSQKEELSKTNKIASQQFENLQIQQFENTFFNLAKTLTELPEFLIGEIPKIRDDHNNNTMLQEVTFAPQRTMVTDWLKGREFLVRAAETLKLFVELESKEHPKSISESFIREKFDVFYSMYLDEFDNYFRLFYNTLKFIDNSRIKDKLRYTSILQAQLSKYELALIYYNGLGSIGKSKLFPLLEKYNFLENVNATLLYKKDNIHLLLYPKTTFRFLDEAQVVKRIATAILDDNDEIGFNDEQEKETYYFSKYNCNESKQKKVKNLVKKAEKVVKK